MLERSIMPDGNPTSPNSPLPSQWPNWTPPTQPGGPANRKPRRPPTDQIPDRLIILPPPQPPPTHRVPAGWARRTAFSSFSSPCVERARGLTVFIHSYNWRSDTRKVLYTCGQTSDPQYE